MGVGERDLFSAGCGWVWVSVSKCGWMWMNEYTVYNCPNMYAL